MAKKMMKRIDISEATFVEAEDFVDAAVENDDYLLFQFERFMKDNSKSSIHYKDEVQIFEIDGYWIMINFCGAIFIDGYSIGDSMTACLEYIENRSHNFSKKDKNVFWNFTGLVTSFKRNNVLLRNADEDNNTLVSEGLLEDSPTVSFRCIANLMNIEGEKNLIKLFVSKSLVIVDYTIDENIKFNKKERRQKPKNRVAPGPGFTDNSNSWHRPGFVLLHDTRKNKTFFLGQDEGTYFGCELADNPKTVQKAIAGLMPKEIREIKGVKRQGEWFIVPVDELPSESVIFEIEGFAEVSLPVDDEESNRHTVENFSGPLIVADSQLYFRTSDGSYLSHDEHNCVYLRDINAPWCTFVKNTAVRSVSEEGVD